MIGKLEETDNLRAVWSTEAKFTAWLAEDRNMKILSEASGLNIAVEEVASPTGDFSVDILASDRDTGKRIVIENQLEETENDYLGQLITYAADKNAKIIIWLARNSRREHKYAVEWLNMNMNNGIKIYLFRIRLYRVGDSEPAVYAVRFEPIVKPDTKSSDNAANIEELRFDYWNKFQDYAFNDAKDKGFASYYKRWANSSTSTLYLGIGRQGTSIFVSKTFSELEAGLYISNDKKLFQYLLGHMDAIESESGIKFEWPVNHDGKDFRISTGKISAQIENRNDWVNQFDWIINTVLNVRKVFGKYISLSSLASGEA